MLRKSNKPRKPAKSVREKKFKEDDFRSIISGGNVMSAGSFIYSQQKPINHPPNKNNALYSSKLSSLF
jgi:hypothetical protein